MRRVLDIWGERQVFPDKFLKELVAILESGKKKDIHDIVDSFQPNQLCTQIKIMKALEDDTEYKLKTLSKSGINNIFDLGNITINDVPLVGVIFYPQLKSDFYLLISYVLVTIKTHPKIEHYLCTFPYLCTYTPFQIPTIFHIVAQVVTKIIVSFILQFRRFKIYGKCENIVSLF